MNKITFYKQTIYSNRRKMGELTAEVVQLEEKVARLRKERLALLSQTNAIASFLPSDERKSLGFK